jgi:hypothetical protein
MKGLCSDLHIDVPSDADSGQHHHIMKTPKRPPDHRRDVDSVCVVVVGRFLLSIFVTEIITADH